MPNAASSEKKHQVRRQLLAVEFVAEKGEQAAADDQPGQCELGCLPELLIPGPEPEHPVAAADQEEQRNRRGNADEIIPEFVKTDVKQPPRGQIRDEENQQIDGRNRQQDEQQFPGARDALLQQPGGIVKLDSGDPAHDEQQNEQQRHISERRNGLLEKQHDESHRKARLRRSGARRAAE